MSEVVFVCEISELLIISLMSVRNGLTGDLQEISYLT